MSSSINLLLFNHQMHFQKHDGEERVWKSLMNIYLVKFYVVLIQAMEQFCSSCQHIMTCLSVQTPCPQQKFDTCKLFNMAGLSHWLGKRLKAALSPTWALQEHFVDTHGFISPQRYRKRRRKK